jgi:hypothetical protein
MQLDLLDLYRRASAWTIEKVAGAVEDLDAPTPCAPWNVRELLNHMLDTQRYFISAARGRGRFTTFADPTRGSERRSGR